MSDSSPSSAPGWADPLDRDLSEILSGAPGPQLPMPSTTAPMVSTAVRLPVEVLTALRTEAATRGIEDTELIQQLVEAALPRLAGRGADTDD